MFATGLNEWKQVKAAHVSKIRTLVNEANMLIDFVLADTGKGNITLVKSLCVLVGISFSLMLVALFLSMAWMALTSAGLVG